MCAQVFCTPRFFHICRRIFRFPRIFPFISRCSNTITSAWFSCANLTMAEAVFFESSSLQRTAYFQRFSALFGPCSRFFFRIRFSTFHRRSFSSAKLMNFLAQTVPSAFMMLHTASVLIPRSTAQIRCSCTGLSASSLFSSYENRRKYFLCLFSRVGADAFTPVQCFLRYSASVCRSTAFTHTQSFPL